MKNKKYSIEVVLSKKELKRQELTQIQGSDFFFFNLKLFECCVLHTAFPILIDCFFAHRGFFFFSFTREAQGMGSKMFVFARSCGVCFLSKLHKGSRFPKCWWGRWVSSQGCRSLVMSRHFHPPLCALYQFSVVTGAVRMKECRGNPAWLWTKAGSSLMLFGAALQVQACSFGPTLTQRHKNVFWKLL